MYTAKQHRQKRKREAIAYLGGKCADCGISDSRVLEFDHAKQPRMGKTLTVSAFLQGSWARLQKELDKCELVCANCHAIRTWNRLNGELA